MSLDVFYNGYFLFIDDSESKLCSDKCVMSL